MTETLNHQSTAEIFLLNTLRPALSELGIGVYELGDAFELRDGSRVPADMPYIVYDLRPQPDQWSKMGVTYTRFDTTVRVVSRGYKRDLEAPVAAIDGALRSAVGEVDGVRVTCRRTATFNAPLYYLSGDNTPTRECGIRAEVKVWEG